MRGIKACAVLMMVFLMTTSVLVTQVGADPVPKTIQGEVLPASDGVEAIPGSAVFYIQNRTSEGQDVDIMFQGGGIEYYFSAVEDSITDWIFGDPGVMIVNVENGTYLGGDRAGYVAYSTALLDATGAQTFPTVELQRIPTPTQTVNGTGFINMSWSALPDPSGLIAGYKIYRSLTNDSDGSWNHVGGSVNAPLTDLWFNDTVTDGVDYYYSVKVCFIGIVDEPWDMTVDNYQNQYFGEGSAPMSSPGAPPTVDYILIMDAAGGVGSEIPDQAVNVGFTINGYAVAYNNTLGFLWDVSVTWSIIQVLGNATTTPGIGTSSDFWSGWIGDTVVWQADDGALHTDVVNITINPPGVDTIDIVDTPGTGASSILDQTVNVGVTITGYAAGFNNTIGYVMDVTVDWTVTPAGLEDATTDPGPATTADFYSGTVGGSVTWTANYNAGAATDTITITINPPTVDSIIIVDGAGTGITEIMNQAVGVGVTITGYAAGFNTTTGTYVMDVSVTWSVIPTGGEDANTAPLSGTTSDFYSGTIAGSVTWTADYGGGVTDTVTITINPPTVDSITIVDGAGTGTFEILDQSVDVGVTITGHAAGFNTTIGSYVMDVSVTWSVTPAGGEDANTAPLSGTTSDFYSGTITGSVTWTADYGGGVTDTVTIGINPPLVDYILIVDTAGTGASEILDGFANLGYTITGWAASFNVTSGYLGDVSVLWSVGNVGSTAFTFPLGPSTSSTFDADLNPGTATWTADDGLGHNDTVIFSVIAATVDYIEIVDTAGTGATAILSGIIGVGELVTGYAAAFNDTIGYLYDIAVDWSVFNGGSNASTNPTTGSNTSVFYSGFLGGVAVWTADDLAGHTYDVTYTISAPSVDSIKIVDTAGTGLTAIGPQTVNVGYSITGYAASFNNTIGYLGDISVDWTVIPTAGEDASTLPATGTSSVFDSGTKGGSVTWMADDLSGHTDTVGITITPPTVDWIDIVDTMSTGATSIADQSVDVGVFITGYAAGFNTTSGYIGDVIVDWTVTPTGGEDAGSDPGPATTANFNSGTIGGSVTWTANYNAGAATDSVIIGINAPTVDYIDIVDTLGTGAASIPDQTLVISTTLVGYAASFNNTIGYLGDISVTWDVIPSATEDAFTNPGTGNTTTFNSGTIGGSVGWRADDGSGHIDIVTITITPYGTEYIEIVDSPGTGLALIVDFSVGVGIVVTGYAAAFNSSAPGSGYIGDVIVTWSVTPSGGEDANTAPLGGTTSDFYSGTIGGSVDWTADDGSGNTDTVTITITPPTVDYIEIVDTAGTGATIIPDQAVGVGVTITGYAATFNITSGYLGDVSVAWSITPTGGEDATTLPPTGTTSDFYSGTISGSVDWIADDLSSHTDTVTITIDPATIDYIDIVDTAGTGATAIPPQSVGVGATITGYAAGFNNTIGYIIDVSVTWSIVPTAGEDASTLPLSGTTSDFYSGTIDGSVSWEANYGVGVTDSVSVTILPPTVDYIEIVDTSGTGTNLISDQLIVTLTTIWGFAAAFNDTVGYLNDVSVTWSAGGVAASTFPNSGTSSQFDAGALPGTATWTADYGGGITDMVTFTITDYTVDYIEIVDTAGTGATIIGNQIVNVAFAITGYVAAFNNSGGGYLGDISVAWSVVPSGGEDASTTPGSGTSSDFDSGTIGGSVDWIANDLMGHTDTVTFTINAPTVDYIEIVDTADTGSTVIGPQTLDVGITVTGYAAAFNDSIGYLYDVSVTWSVTPLGSEDANTAPLSGTTSDFYSGTIGGSVTWDADYNSGAATDSVSITINPPTVDYIEIVDTALAGATAITDFTVGVGITVTGYAAAFNNIAGYLYDVSVTWSVTPTAGEDADTTPTTGDTSDIYSGTIGGTVDWEADYLGMTYTVTITINPATIDYIDIVDTMGTGATTIPDQAVDVGVMVTGYAAGFNNTIGYISDQTVSWSVTPTATEDADTVPASGTTSDFDSGTIGGSVTWTADLGGGITDSVIITINPPTVDYIDIVDTVGTGATSIPDQNVGVGESVTGFAASFNNTAGYIGDITVSWTVVPAGTEDASTLPGSGATSDFASGTIGGSVTWTADDLSGHTDSVIFTIAAPTIDYLRIEDATGGGNNLVAGLTYIVYQTDTFYLAGYNLTSDFVGMVDAEIWSINPASGVGGLTYTTPSNSVVFDAEWVTTASTCTVTAIDSDTGLSNTTGTLTVLAPTVDSIMIMDTAANAGAEVTDETYGVHRTTDTFYAAAFNDTVGYLRDESVSWTSDTPAVGAVTPTGDSTTFIAQDVTADGTCIVTADYGGGITDTTGTLTVLAPTVDSIKIEDAAANAGNEVTSLTMNDDQTDDLYAAGYNATSGYVEDIAADWTVDIGSVSPASGTMTTYDAAAGTGTLTATYNSLTADVTLTVRDVTGPATPGVPIVGLVDDKPVITLPPLPPSDVAEYKVERQSDDGTWETIATVPAGTLLVTDEDVQAGKTYNYRIIAVDDTGNDSPPSPSVEVKIPDKEEELPWVLLLLIIIIVIIILLLLLYLMTRKKEEEEEMPLEEEAPPEMPEEELPPEEEGIGAAALAPPPGAAAEEAAPEERLCPSCGGKMEYIEDYDQYYCYTCGKYDSEFEDEGGEGGEEMPEGEGEPPSEEPGGEEPSEEGPSGEEPSEGGPEGEEPSGEGPSGEEPSERGPEGEEPSGEGPSGEKPSGEEPPGEGGTESEENPPEY